MSESINALSLLKFRAVSKKSEEVTVDDIAPGRTRTGNVEAILSQ